MNLALLILFLLPTHKPSCGNGVTLAWTPDPAAAGSMVYMGTTSGVYTNVVDVGQLTTNQICHLVGGRTYYFAVTDYDALGLESGFSNEIAYSVPPPRTNYVVTVTGATETASSLAGPWLSNWEDPWTRTNEPGPLFFRHPFMTCTITNWSY